MSRASGRRPARGHSRRPVAWAMPAVFVTLLAALTGGYGIQAPAPPGQQEDLCQIFQQQPRWYDHARQARERWGTPIATQMAFVYHESSFRSHVRPPRSRLWGLIPWRRPSSAYGYAQAQDPAWSEYREAAGSMLAERTQMRHALDFIGWYNRRTHEQLGIALDNPEHLYLAYHEGRTGYRRLQQQPQPAVQGLAQRVARRSALYGSQLQTCERELRCRRFYQVGPLCPM